MLILIIYISIFVLAYVIYTTIAKFTVTKIGFNARKTVTFGDESAVTSNRAASIISVISIFLIWGAFTGSKIVPVHVPGPFVGDTSFSYTASP